MSSNRRNGWFLDPVVHRFARAPTVEVANQLVDHRRRLQLIASLGIAHDVRQVEPVARADQSLEEQILVALARTDVADLSASEGQVERVGPSTAGNRPSPSPQRKTTRNGSDRISRSGETTTPSAR